MSKEIKTIEALAAMINMHVASKEAIKAVREDIAEVHGRLDRIQKQILANYGRRIESLEQDLKRLRDALAV
jgi:predicted  nucleic acid-binding Zn-ribbon protein